MKMPFRTFFHAYEAGYFTGLGNKNPNNVRPEPVEYWQVFRHSKKAKVAVAHAWNKKAHRLNRMVAEFDKGVEAGKLARQQNEKSKVQAAIERRTRSGGLARATKLTPERRSEIGRLGAMVRWAKTKKLEPAESLH